MIIINVNKAICENVVKIDGTKCRLPIDDIKLVAKDNPGCIIFLKSGGALNVKDSLEDIDRRFNQARLRRGITDANAVKP